MNQTLTLQITNETLALGRRPVCTPGSPVEARLVDPHIVENITAASLGRVFPDWEITLKILFYVFSFVTAVLGNSMVILTIILNKKMKTKTNCLILNLAVSDFLIALLCTWIHLGSNITSDWPFGAVVCKLKNFFQVLVVTSSTMTLLVISGDRMVAIVFPLRSRLSTASAGFAIFMSWFLSIAVALPQLVIMQQKELYWKNRHEVWCEESWPRVYSNEECEIVEPGRTIYYTVYVVIMYFIAVSFMIGAYTLIMVTIVKRKLPGNVTDSSIAARHTAKRKIIRMLMAVVVIFIICWTPQQILLLWEVYRTPGKYPRFVDDIKYAALYIAYSNSAINPIIYGGLNKNFRRSFLQICQCVRLRNRNRILPETVPHPVDTQTNQEQSNV